ncbi:glycosyltransferase family 4 protein [Pelotomaculum isophthalicicum JI]|uniref:Glycosyltransferase family 4 protein n=1 Tax=Pelotomaculum isophthalicicum JI TaxID=947010 RepID=A0A9X4H7R5_9FIRM|nr:glycosyltransferase family 4 protein [Pelotomaculum isophthalicicum]MDF9407894.1 glycosyltransferase family 4 protein [Pelotomaculum isophthalicicum JI]
MLYNILFTYVLVGRGGDAVQVNAFVEGFKNLGCQVVLTGPSPIKPYEFGSAEGKLRNVARRLPWWAKDIIEAALGLVTIRRAKNSIKKKKFDLIFHRAGIYDFAGCLLKKKNALPLIVHLDAPFPIEREYKGERYFKFFHKAAMKNIGKHADLVVTMSEQAKGYFVNLGIPEQRILVLPNGISHKRLQRGIALAAEHKPFFNEKKITLGFLGNLSRWHKVDLLLEAVKLLIEKQTHKYYLVVVGKGEEYEKLKEKTDVLGISGYVEWVGHLPPGQAFEEIAKFDIAILPHTLTTGAPMKLFEYAALARPVVAPDLENINSLFCKDTEICLFDPGNVCDMVRAIELISSKKELALTMGVKMQERVKSYTWESIIKKILDAIAQKAI